MIRFIPLILALALSACITTRQPNSINDVLKPYDSNEAMPGTVNR